MLLGVVGHDPWKSQDAVAFGVAVDMIERGDALAPRLVGEPYLRPARRSCTARRRDGDRRCRRGLPLHDAARVAAALFVALTLLLLAATATELNGAKYRWVTVLLFIGSVGLWERAHQLSPELGLMLGIIAAAQYGLALAVRRPVAGGALLGLGAGIGFLLTGLAGPVWLAVVALVLPRLSRRGARAPTRRPRRSVLGIAIVLLPRLAARALRPRAGASPIAWWSQQSIGDLSSRWPIPLRSATPRSWPRTFRGTPGPRCRSCSGHSTPAVAASTAASRRRGWSSPRTFAAVIAFAITAMADPRLLTLMPLLVPLCLLAVLEIDTLPRGFSGALDWFGILTFGLLTVLLWWLWFDAYTHGMPLPIARLFRDLMGRRSSAVSLGGVRAVAVPDAALARAGPPGPALESAARSSTGRLG